MIKPVIERLKDRIREHGENYKIDQLCLDEIPFENFTPEYCKAIEKCINVEYITLQSCKIANLSTLPRLPKLQNLQLDQNYLDDSSLKDLTLYPTLKELTLKNNKIEKVESFEPLTSCKNIYRLQVDGNPVSKIQNYRNLIFSLLPQLEVIDGINRSGNQVIINDEEDSSSISGSQSDSQSEEEPGQRQSPTKMRKNNESK